MNDAFNAIPLSKRELQLLAWTSRSLVKLWLWVVTIVVLPWFVLGLISTAAYLIMYYRFDVLNDQPQPFTVPGLSSVVEVVGPQQLLTEDTPYTLTLSSTPTITQPFTVTLVQKTGVTVEPRTSFSFAFLPRIYQTYQIPFRNSEEGGAPATFIFTDATTRHEISIPKASLWALWWQKLFVFSSLTEGIVPLVVSIITVLLAVSVQRGEQWRARQLFATLRQTARSSESEATVQELCDKLEMHSTYLSDAQMQLVDNLIYLQPEELLDLVEKAEEWQDEYIGRILVSNNPQLAQRLLDLEKLGKLRLDHRQRSIVHNMLGWGTVEYLSPDPGPRPSEQFAPEAADAENDHIEYFCEDALLENDRPSWIAADPQITTVALHGMVGSGKTATLNHLSLALADQPEPPLHVILPFEPSFSSPDVLVKQVLKHILDYLLKLMHKHPQKWLELNREQRLKVLGLYIHVLKVPVSRMEELAKAIAKENSVEGRQFRQLLKQVQRRDKWTSRRNAEYNRFVTGTVQCLRYSALLICLDNVEPELSVQTLRTILEAAFPIPILLVLAYKGATSHQLNNGPQNYKAIHLEWGKNNPDGLAKVLDYRTNLGRMRPLSEEVRAELLKIVRVPRDFWPWWNLLTHPLIHRDPKQDITLTEWNQAVQVMQQVREKRSSHNGSWTMEDYHVARQLLEQSHIGQPA